MKKISVIAAVFITLFVISGKFSFAQVNDEKLAAPKVCPVSGETIDEGKGIDVKYLDKTYTFCCEHCIAKFKKEPMSYIKEDIKCPVGGESASKDVFTTYDGVKYYFCCKSCIKKFESEPEKYLNKDKQDNK